MSWRLKRILVIVSLLALVLAALGWAFVEGLGLARTNEAIVRARGEASALQLRIAGFEEAPASKALSRATWLLPEQPNIAEVLRSLEATAREVGVRIERIEPSSKNPAGQQAIRARGVGRPTEVARLLASIEQRSRLVLIEGARFAGVSADVVRFDLQLVAYHDSGRQ